jgi:hypothetical protein
MPNNSPYRALLPERVPNTNDSIANNDDHIDYSVLLPERIKREKTDDRPIMIKAAGKLTPEIFFPRLKARFNVVPWDEQKRYWEENFYKANQDIIKDYMHNTGSTYEEAMKWAVKQDALNENRTLNEIRNPIEKELNKQALKRDGIKRIN